MPAWDLVVVHRVNTNDRTLPVGGTDPGTSISREEYGRLLALILEARPQVARGGQRRVEPKVDTCLRAQSALLTRAQARELDATARMREKNAHVTEPILEPAHAPQVASDTAITGAGKLRIPRRILGMPMMLEMKRPEVARR